MRRLIPFFASNVGDPERIKISHRYIQPSAEAEILPGKNRTVHAAPGSDAPGAVARNTARLGPWRSAACVASLMDQPMCFARSGWSHFPFSSSPSAQSSRSSGAHVAVPANERVVMSAAASASLPMAEGTLRTPGEEASRSSHTPGGCTRENLSPMFFRSAHGNSRRVRCSCRA